MGNAKKPPKKSSSVSPKKSPVKVAVKKKIKSPKINAGQVKKQVSKPSFFQLIPLGSMEIIVPYVPEDQQSEFEASVKKITGKEYKTPISEILRTPKGKHIQPTADGVCGKTPGGTELIYSPSKNHTFTVTSPNGDSETKALVLLVRKKDKETKQESIIFSELKKLLVTKSETTTITASPQTRQSQPPRKQQRKEKTIVGASAKDVVIMALEEEIKKTPTLKNDIDNMIWHLSHVQGYANSKNARGHMGKPFDPQQKENILAATRTLNVNMMRIENVLLKLINDKLIKEYTCVSTHCKFEKTHVLASLYFKIKIITHHDFEISFDYQFDVADNRKLSTEASTAYYALLKSIIENPMPSSDEEDKKSTDNISGVSKKLFY